MAKVVRLTEQQEKAIELLTCGEGLQYKEICRRLGICRKTLWNWLHSPSHVLFQEELERVNSERWDCIIDAARESAMRLVKGDNQKMVEFVLKNAGYNPTQKIEAEVKNDIVINIEE